MLRRLDCVVATKSRFIAKAGDGEERLASLGMTLNINLGLDTDIDAVSG
jgi:hypothetical protein